jgi:nucleoid-associated protein YejK
LEASWKALETELKAKLRSTQLTAKENIGSLLARVNGGKNELNKAKRDLLNSSKSLSKALKSGPAQAKQVMALQLANKHFRDELADARLKLKGVSKVHN